MKKTSLVAIFACGAGLLTGCQTASHAPAESAASGSAKTGHGLTDAGRSAEVALASIKAGNERVPVEHPQHPDQGLVWVHELEAGQHPCAIIVSCSESRVPPEMVLDEGLGDLLFRAVRANVDLVTETLRSSHLVLFGHLAQGSMKVVEGVDGLHTGAIDWR